MRRFTLRQLRPVHALALASLPLLAGCIPQDKYDHLLTVNRSLEEQLVTMEDDRDGARQNVSTLQQDLNTTRAAHRDLQGRYGELDSAYTEIAGDNSDLLSRVSDIEPNPLPMELELALEELVRSYPDLVSFDRDRGMLRFASDVTFGLGSATLSDAANDAARRIAGVLGTSAAMGFEVRIVGHTDNVKIGKPETRRQHPTNVHLSVHRAIAVRTALVEAGIDPVRVEVSGYGQYRPIVANDSKGAAAANRRVEIFILPMPELGAVAMPARATAAPTPVTAQPEPEIISK